MNLTWLLSIILIGQLKDTDLKKEHGFLQKLILGGFTSFCGVLSVIYLLMIYSECEDNMSVKFILYEYGFVFGTFSMAIEYARYYKKRVMTIGLSGYDRDCLCEE